MCNVFRGALAPEGEEASKGRGEDCARVLEQGGSRRRRQRGTPKTVAEHHVVHRRQKGEYFTEQALCVVPVFHEFYKNSREEPRG